MKRICIYGKGGIGNSTTVANVAAAMAEMGRADAVKRRPLHSCAALSDEEVEALCQF